MEHHQTLSPSSFPAFAQCPCYQGGESSEAANRGTAAHRYLECLLTNQAPDVELPQDDLDGVIWAFDQITRATSEQRLIEQKLTLIDDDFSVVTFGTADVIDPKIDDPWIIDFKTGQKRDYKPQMAVYSLIAMEQHGWSWINVAILYSRLQWVETYRMTLDEARAIAWPIIRAVQNPDKQPKPCDYCSWCAKRDACPALIGTVNEVILGRGAQPPATFHFSEITDPRQFAEVADKVRYARKVVNEAYSAMLFRGKVLIENGVPIPGYALKEKNSKREITDIMKAFEQLGMKPQDFISCCSASLPKLEKTLGKTADLKPAAAKKALAERLNGLISAGTPTTYLAPVKSMEEGKDEDAES